MTTTITVYTKPACVQCDWTKRLFDKHGTGYGTTDITEDAGALAKIKELGYLQAPVVLVQERGKEDVHWSGFQPAKIEGYAVKGAA